MSTMMCQVLPLLSLESSFDPQELQQAQQQKQEEQQQQQLSDVHSHMLNTYPSFSPQQPQPQPRHSIEVNFDTTAYGNQHGNSPRNVSIVAVSEKLDAQNQIVSSHIESVVVVKYLRYGERGGIDGDGYGYGNGYGYGHGTSGGGKNHHRSRKPVSSSPNVGRFSGRVRSIISIQRDNQERFVNVNTKKTRGRSRIRTVFMKH